MKIGIQTPLVTLSWQAEKAYLKSRPLTETGRQTTWDTYKSYTDNMSLKFSIKSLSNKWGHEWGMRCTQYILSTKYLEYWYAMTSSGEDSHCLMKYTNKNTLYFYEYSRYPEFHFTRSHMLCSWSKIWVKWVWRVDEVGGGYNLMRLEREWLPHRLVGWGL